MDTVLARKPAAKPFILSKGTEEILRAIHFYRFMAAQDVCRLLYSPKSLTYVREILCYLAGGQDYSTNQYLYRFELPHVSRGNTEKIYALGSRGRKFLGDQFGLPIEDYFRPSKLKHLSYGQVVHNVTLTRFLVAAHAWAAKQPNFRISQTRICYQLSKTASMVEIITTEGKTEKIKVIVIPDAWVCFEKLKDADHQHQHYLPIILEIDKGSEHQVRLRNHVRSRIAYIQGGSYRGLFHTSAAVIAYVTTGERPEYRETRRKAICRFIMEVLQELGKPSWVSIFRVCSVVPEELYSTPLFDAPIWQKPGSPTPVTLFTP